MGVLWLNLANLTNLTNLLQIIKKITKLISNEYKNKNKTKM